MNPTTSSTHQKNIIIAAIIILVAIIGALLLFKMTTRQPSAAPLPNTAINIPERKREILAVVSESEGKLSESDKRSIIGDISGENFSKYEFSEEEKIRLIKALNN